MRKLLRDGGSGERLLALKVLDNAYRDVVAICGPQGKVTFQPGVVTSEEDLNKEAKNLEAWLLESAFTVGSFEYWAGLADISAKDMDTYRSELLSALDEREATHASKK